MREPSRIRSGPGRDGCRGRGLRAADLAGWILAAAAIAGCGGDARPPNVLLVTLDTTRADALSCYGAAEGTTPVIDGLARRGVLFENAYSASNVTKPAHVSILSGRRAIAHGVFSNQVLVPDDVVALPALLRRRGWSTAAFVGAIQLGERSGIGGFDVVRGPRRAARDGREVVADAIRWLAREPAEPFFLWVHLFDPHTLYKPPTELARRFYRGDPRVGPDPPIAEEPFVASWEYPPMHAWLEGVRDRDWAPAMYAAEVAYADALVGRLLGHLGRTERLERTAVILTADHGESLGEHGVFYDHAGLYEPSIRIPLVLQWPGIAGGRRVSRPVTQLDLFPTLADLLGLPIADATDGRSLRPLLEGGAEDADGDDEVLVFESAHNHHVAVRQGRWKAIWPVFDSHRYFEAEPELYDLEVDPDETENVFDDHPDVVARLRPHAEPWLALGEIEKGELPEVDEDVLEALGDLGYAR